MRRTITDGGLKKLKATTRKAWSVRVLRWLELMPGDIKEADMTKKAVKEELKKWIRHVIPVRGDRILWGKPLVGEQRRRRAKENRRPHDQGGGETEEGVRLEGLTASQPALAATSQQENRETVTTEVTQQGLRQGRGKWRLEQGRRDMEESKTAEEKKTWKDGMAPGGLPCSQAAVVLTSPKGSRETGSRKARLSGEPGEEVGTGSARKPPQVRDKGDPWLTSIRTVRGQCCAGGERRKCCKVVKTKRVSWIGGLAKGWTNRSLCWSRVVKTCASLPR